MKIKYFQEFSRQSIVIDREPGNEPPVFNKHLISSQSGPRLQKVCKNSCKNRKKLSFSCKKPKKDPRKDIICCQSKSEVQTDKAIFGACSDVRLPASVAQRWPGPGVVVMKAGARVTQFLENSSQSSARENSSLALTMQEWTVESLNHCKEVM